MNIRKNAGNTVITGSVAGCVAFVFDFDSGFVDVHLLVTRLPGDSVSIDQVILIFVDQQLMRME